MERSTQQPLDDSALKVAIRRTWGAEQAPGALRARVSAIIAAAPPPGTSPSPAPRRWPLGPGATGAAVAIVGISVALYVFVLRAKTLPADLIQQAISRHDEFAAAPDERQPGIPRENPSEAGLAMEQRLGFPVLTGRLHNGYQFAGASICDVGPHNAAHLLFRKGASSVSIFSLPASAFPAGKPGINYDTTESNHSVAGFAQDGGVYIVVASGPDDFGKIQRIRTLRDQLKPNLAPECRLPAATQRVPKAGY